jgi:integrase
MPRRELSSFFLLAAKVRDSTRHRYKAAVDDFIHWCDDNGIEANSRSDIDWELLEYIHEEYERNDGKGRTHLAHTMAGLQLFVPQLRGHLRLSAQALLGWKARHPGQRHPPLTWDLTVAIAAQLARWGRFDMAVATLLAFCALLRIGELVSLRVEDFLDADSDDPRVDASRVSGLRLRKTKTADNLFAELHTASVIQLMRVLTASKRSDARIFDFSAGTFRK